MASSTGKSRCVICNKEKSAVRCEGCLKIFCRIHFNNHCEELSQQLDELEFNRDELRQNLIERINHPEKHVFIQQIEQWKRQSIELIKKTARECKKVVLYHASEHFKQIELKLSKLTNQLKEIRRENDLNEIELKEFKEKLIKLEEEFDSMAHISIRQDSTSFIDKISIVETSELKNLLVSKINMNTKWKQNGLTIAGGNGRDNQCFYIVDSENHRIIRWIYNEKTGHVVAGGNGPGNQTNQLKDPRSVIMDKKTDSLIISDRGNRRVVRWSCRNGTNGEIIIANIDCYDLKLDINGNLYVSDDEHNEVRLWKIDEKWGTIVAGGNGQGNRLNQLDTPTYIFVDADQSIFISDWNNHRVMKWMKGGKEGMIVAGGQNEGNALTQLSHPQMLTVDHLGNIYVADSWNHRVVRWSKGMKQGIIIAGSNWKGTRSDQLSGPIGLSFDREDNLYVVDHSNDRIQKFEIDLN